MGELAGWLAGLGLALDLVALVASALATWFWYLERDEDWLNRKGIPKRRIF